MTNGNFSLDDVLAALDALGLDVKLHGRRDVGPLRFCSAFAQEARGLYFWEGDAAPAFEHADIVVLTARPLSGDIACQIEVSHPQRAFYLLMRHFFAAPAASVLRPRITLARGVVVGAGAVVTRDVDQESVVVSGVPARLMDTKASHAGVPKLPS